MLRSISYTILGSNGEHERKLIDFSLIKLIQISPGNWVYLLRTQAIMSGMPDRRVVYLYRG